MKNKKKMKKLLKDGIGSCASVPQKGQGSGDKSTKWSRDSKFPEEKCDRWLLDSSEKYFHPIRQRFWICLNTFAEAKSYWRYMIWSSCETSWGWFTFFHKPCKKFGNYHFNLNWKSLVESPVLFSLEGDWGIDKTIFWIIKDMIQIILQTFFTRHHCWEKRDS